MNVHIRWLVTRDFPEVLRIENTFEFPWDLDDFKRELRERNVVAMVAEHDEQVVGYMVYELHKTAIEVLNFAVRADCRRQGVGTAMVDKLKGKLAMHRRTCLRLAVCDRNLDAQLFWRSMGFRAVTVMHNYYPLQPNEVAYQFVYQYQDAPLSVRVAT